MLDLPTRSERLARLVAACALQPWRAIAPWLATVLLALAGVAQLEIDTTIGSFLDRSGESWLVYQRSLRDFGGDEFVVVALDGAVPLSAEVLARVVDWNEKFEQVPGVRRVDSLASVGLIRPAPSGGAALDPGLARDRLDERGRHQLASWLQADRVAPGSLISDDQRLLAINVRLHGDVDANRESVVAELRELVGEEPALLSGVPVFQAGVSERMRSEVLLFVPVTLVLVSLLLVCLIGSPRAITVALAMGGTGSVVCLGVMGALGSALSVSTMVLPSVLLALGCAYSMHLLTAVSGRGERADIAEAASRVAGPVVFSGITTALGFLAMATVRIGVIRDLATYGAIGVFTLTLAAVTLAPALVALLPLHARPTRLDRWLRSAGAARVTALAARRSGAIIVLWSVALAAIGLGIARVEISSDIIPWFARGTHIRDSYETIRERLSGITPVNVVIESEDGEPVTRPDVIAQIAALTHDLEALPQVGRALSIGDMLQQLHEVLTPGGVAGPPDDYFLIEEYLVILESADELRDVLRFDHAAANVVVRVDSNASREILALAEWVDGWWSENGVAGFRATTTGIMYEFGRAQDEIAWGQIRGLLLAFAVIGGLLFALLRSARWAVIALLPNVIPIGMAFGFMGLVGIPLDAATVCLGSLAFGIAVDDTVHVMVAVAEARAREGESATVEEAVRVAFSRVLPALVFTTATIALGFLALGLSDFTLIRNLGLVTSGVVLVCLLADATLLPALLLRSEPPTRA